MLCIHVLQPSNLFVVPSEKGKSHLLKLADFGLCRSLTQDMSTHRSSTIGMLNVFSDHSFFIFRTISEIQVYKQNNYKILTADVINALFYFSSCLVLYDASVRMFCSHT